MNLRSLLLLVVFLLACVAGATPSYAKLISLAQHVGKGELQSACDAAGGEFSNAPDGSGGCGCGTNCKGGKGTNCYVACDSGGKCVGQTPGRLVANVTLLQFLSGEFIRPLPTTSDDSGTPSHNAPSEAPALSAPPAGAPAFQ